MTGRDAPAPPVSGAPLEAGVLTGWFDRAGRDLPWRRPGTSPWEVLLCEVMSQQTPVTRVEPAWRAWLDRWPGPAELADASPAEVLRMWGKLGYPRRALRLQECARVLVERHGGEVPTDLDDLLALPGVGDYTARAVLCFAHGRAVPVVDTNVRRVVARAVDGRGDAGPPRGRRDLAAVEALLPADEAVAARWSVAVMELGALVCTARSPRCTDCPVESRCAWVAAGRPEYDGPRRAVQRFAGTDRQVRGLLLDVLRDGDGPVGRETLDGVWPDNVQRDRALASLLVDGLLVERGGRYALPGSAEEG